MSIFTGAIAAYTSGESIGKLLAGALVGAVAMFFALGGCGKTEYQPFTGDSLAVNPPDTVNHTDTLIKLVPVKTGEGSFSFTVNTDAGMFSAESDFPYPLRNLIIPSKTIYDTVFIRTFENLSRQPLVSLEHRISGALSPIFERALAFGWSTEASHKDWRLAIKPELMMKFDSLPSFEPYVFVEVSYKL